jgi:D-galactarolactone cycloisomerase
MTIVSVQPIPVTFPLEREPMALCFVRIETSDGLVGYGEACDSFGCSYAGVVASIIDDAFTPLLLGEEVHAPDAMAQRLRAWTRRRIGDTWLAAHARSAVEIALWDLAGKAAGRPVSGLLGRARDTVAVYASGGFLEEGDASFHHDQLEPLLERGVAMVKVRVGPDWRRDLVTLDHLRDRLAPEIELMVDGSENFTVPTAIEISARLAELGVRWFEEPLPQGARAGIEELVRQSPVPIAYGEHLFGTDETSEVLRRGQAQVLQPDASTCGGISEARAMASLAAPYGVRVVPHVCAGPISLAANLHLAASVPSIRAIEYPPFLREAWEQLGLGASLTPDAIVGGAIPVPSGPGLGVDLDEAVARSHPYSPPGRLAGVRQDADVSTSAPQRRGLPDRFTGDR